MCLQCAAAGALATPGRRLLLLVCSTGPYRWHGTQTKEPGCRAGNKQLTVVTSCESSRKLLWHVLPCSHGGYSSVSLQTFTVRMNNSESCSASPLLLGSFSCQLRCAKMNGQKVFCLLSESGSTAVTRLWSSIGRGELQQTRPKRTLKC